MTIRALPRKLVRLARKRLFRPPIAAAMVAFAFGATGGLLGPVTAEASCNPTLAGSFITCGLVPSSNPGPSSVFTVPSSTIDIQKPSSDLTTPIDLSVLAPPAPPKPKPKPKPPIIKIIGAAALAALLAKSVLTPPGCPGSCGPPSKGGKSTTTTHVTKPVTTTTTPTKGKTFAPGPGQRPRPKKVPAPGVNSTVHGTIVATPINSNNSRKNNGRQQQGQKNKQQTNKAGSGVKPHTSNIRPSSKQRHQKGQGRQQRDQQNAQQRKDEVKRKNAAKRGSPR